MGAVRASEPRIRPFVLARGGKRPPRNRYGTVTPASPPMPGPPRQPVADGELLVLLDGAATFGEIAPLRRECALAGLWQIRFLGMRDARTRVKLPSHLPFDGASFPASAAPPASDSTT